MLPFCFCQTTVVLVVVLLQNRAVNGLFSAARSGDTTLAERAVFAAIVAEQRQIFWDFFGFLHTQATDAVIETEASP
jgi:hypothetical protein